LGRFAFKNSFFNFMENVIMKSEKSSSKSLMTIEKKAEIDGRSSLYKQGKLKTSSWETVKKQTRLK
jgi:hypothetical protein